MPLPVVLQFDCSADYYNDMVREHWPSIFTAFPCVLTAFQRLKRLPFSTGDAVLELS